MDGPGDHAFARAGLTRDQDRRDIAGCNLLRRPDRLLNSGGAADDSCKVVLLGLGFRNRSYLFPSPTLGLLALSDIAHDRKHQSPVLPLDHRMGNLNRNSFSTAVQVERFEGCVLIFRQLTDNHASKRATHIGGLQIGHLHCEQLLARIAEQLAGGLVGFENVVALAHQEDRVVGLLKKCLVALSALAPGLLGPFSPGGLFVEQDDPADFTTRAIPWPNLPAIPFYGPIGTNEKIFLACFNRSRQASLMDLFPSIRNVRKNLIMTPADYVLIAQIVIR